MCLWLPQQELHRLYHPSDLKTPITHPSIHPLLVNKSSIESCYRSSLKLLTTTGINTPRKDNTPLLHWHVKLNYKDYWRANMAMTNFNHRLNYMQWTLVVQYRNLNNVTQVFSFDYKPLVPYGSINDTGMFHGMKCYRDLLTEAGPLGNVQPELLLQKDQNTITLKQGWAFPHKVYFNGDECALPPPDS
ncbi:COBRA-like protein 4 [Elaeis guineensis]|uniref:COBRA-like protein 4 n=1 Tax=Elaeis guineensis var. tenera TaxID=51953 RepID=UPI003C6DB78A